jgi:hypothetical protein
LHNLEDNGDINGAWDGIRENIKISAKECIGHCKEKRHKPWFDEDVQNWLIEGSRLKYSGCSTQV